jgi:hypothetical protein
MLDFPVWIPAKRIAYLDHETGIPIKSPPKPGAIVWLRERPHEGFPYPDFEAKAFLEQAFSAAYPGKAIVP